MAAVFQASKEIELLEPWLYGKALLVRIRLLARSLTEELVEAHGKPIIKGFT